jgi:hypothetical protein
MVTQDTSIWSSLRNPTFLRLWLALVVSGCCVSAHDMAATWAMNSLGAPTLWLSLMSSAATLPFFLFTLPAGALADLVDRRRLYALWSELWTLHIGPDTPTPRRHLGVQHWVPEESATSRLKPKPIRTEKIGHGAEEFHHRDTETRRKNEN